MAVMRELDFKPDVIPGMIESGVNNNNNNNNNALFDAWVNNWLVWGDVDLLYK